MNKKLHIDMIWRELEKTNPSVMGTDIIKESFSIWEKYFIEQSWEYNATVLMLYLVSQGETLI